MTSSSVLVYHLPTLQWHQLLQGTRPRTLPTFREEARLRAAIILPSC